MANRVYRFFSRVFRFYRAERILWAITLRCTVCGGSWWRKYVDGSICAGCGTFYECSLGEFLKRMGRGYPERNGGE